jgi:TolB-like protein/Flp pilus assembly protein TadD
MSFFTELKRRNVVRMAGLYLVGAWLLVQVASTMLPAFDAPTWLLRGLIITLAVCLISVLIFSWIFGLTPQGLKRDEGVSPTKSLAPQTARRMDRLIIVVLVLALGYFCFDKFVLTPRREVALIATASSPNEHEAAAGAKSIAVLPLVNESGEKDEQYFSDGLSEDLITALSRFAGLKVIGRNSFFQFRDSKESSGTIGARLGVAHLLEGSVRRAADVVRIGAELVNAADGTTLWSQHYDRPYKDLFMLQDDITTAVASALKTKLLSVSEASAQSDRPPSGNLAAYNAFLQGQFYSERNTGGDYRKAVNAYKTAVALDPRYARAYADLALSETFLTDSLAGIRARESFGEARSAANTALTLNPDLAAAHNARGLVLLFGDIDIGGTEAEVERAVQLAPNDLNARGSLAQMRAALGRPEEAIEALTADPRNSGWYSLLALDLMALGRLDEAEDAVHHQIALQSTDSAIARLSTIELLRGNAAAALEKAEQIAPGKTRDLALANARQIGQDRAAADAALQTVIDRCGETDAYFISRIYALRKDPDKMFGGLDRAWAQHDNNISILYYDPFLLRYKDDPRFAAFCREVGLPTPAEVASGSKS